MPGSPSARRPQTFARVIGGLSLCVGLWGCGGGGPKLYPVTGKVLYEGQPAEGAQVVFHPVGVKDAGAPKPSGVAGPDGTFTLNTHPHGAGAPPGEYQVVVTWFPPGSRALESAPKSKIPERYTDPAKSNLRATVKDGPTELEPFRLTK